MNERLSNNSNNEREEFLASVKESHPDLYLEIQKRFKDRSAKIEAIDSLLKPINGDDSVEAWNLRDSLLESIHSADEDIYKLEMEKLNVERRHSTALAMDDTDEYNKMWVQIHNDPEYGKLLSDIGDIGILKEYILNILIINITTLLSDKSLEFREKLFQKDADPSLLIGSLESAELQNNQKAIDLKEKIFKIANDDFEEDENFNNQLGLDNLDNKE